MIDLCSSPEKCSGCTSCENICPRNAISMKIAYNGFNYPEIDKSKCIECGLCLEACDFKQFKKTGNKPKAYAVRNTDAEEVRTSRSGAVIMALCHEIVERGGVCFGCELTPKLVAVHKMEDTYDGCKRFKGSKYVQSDMGSCFVECAKQLQAEKWVLFSGTGCQVHGLLRYLDIRKIPRDKLIAVDIVCHGVPSPGVWSNYLTVYQNKINSKIEEVDFRDKQINGWREHIEKYVTIDGATFHNKQWTEIFYRHVLFREACYNCPYTTTERLSDFTIADYWGVDKNAPEFDDNKGCSLVITHTKKAEAFLNEMQDLITIKETNLKTSMQPQLSKPIWKGWDYNIFWSMYRRSPEKCIEKWFFPSWSARKFRIVEKEGKRCLKKIIKIIKRRK